MKHPFSINTKIYNILNDGIIQTQFHVAFVAGIMYHGTEWLLGKNSLCKYGENCREFATEKIALNAIKKYENKDEIFVRKYYYWKNTGKLTNDDFKKYQILSNSKNKQKKLTFERYLRKIYDLPSNIK